MTLQEIIGNDLEDVIEKDLGNQTITWKDEDYFMVPSSEDTMNSLDIGGYDVVIDKVVNVRKNQFTDDIFPKSQEQVTFADKIYVIQKVKEDATRAFYKLFLTDPNRGI